MKNNRPFSDEKRRFSAEGVCVSEGIALGRARIIKEAQEEVPRYFLKKSEASQELNRFKQAVSAAAEDLKRARDKLNLSALPGDKKEFPAILDAQILLLESSALIRNIRTRISDALLNAEAAVEDGFREAARKQSAVSDPYLAERAADIRALGRRILRLLANDRFRIPEQFSEDVVLVAGEFYPAEIAVLKRDKVKGLVTAKCGAYSHAAILARALGIPVLSCEKGVESLLRDGDLIYFDDMRETLYVNPTEERVAEFLRKRRDAAEKNILKDAFTADGERVSVLANIELPEEITADLADRADGIGLLRTEFLFIQSGYEPPSEETQFAVLRAINAKLKGKVFTIRTLDIGGDKTPLCLQNYAYSEFNPALGIRGIRFSLKYPEFFTLQIRAILRAAAEGDIRILLPMVSDVEEIRAAKAIIQSCYDDLSSEGAALPPRLPPVGVMIEIPAAAICADVLARESDFFAIGSNDLTQYTFAADRNNQDTADYFKTEDAAVLRLNALAVKAALSANIPIHVCGEPARDPTAAADLLHLGIRAFSVSPPAINRLKRVIQNTTAAAPSPEGRRALEFSRTLAEIPFAANTDGAELLKRNEL